MIAFGCITTAEGDFWANAAPSMQRVVEGDSLLMRCHEPPSVATAANQMLAQAAADEALEATVLVDQDAVTEGGDLLASIRALFSTAPEVALIGAVPACGIPGLVEEDAAVDGTLLALSPWATRELRFDDELRGPLDVCAIDMCLQAQAQGRRVIASDELQVSRRTDRGSVLPIEALVTLRLKWLDGGAARQGASA